MPGLSQAACLWEAGPVGGAPKLADHNVMYESTSGSSGWQWQSKIIIYIIIIIIYIIILVIWLSNTRRGRSRAVVLVADAHNTSRGPKCQILTKNPPFPFFQNKVGYPPYPYKNFERKSYF